MGMIKDQDKKALAKVFCELTRQVKLVMFTQEVQCEYCQLTRETASLLDMDWHPLTAGQTVDATEFERQSMARIQMLPESVLRYRSPHFNHIFSPGGGYSAGYYSYIWSEVLDADAFQAFKEKGIFDQATACSFRTNILERGGARMQ